MDDEFNRGNAYLFYTLQFRHHRCRDHHQIRRPAKALQHHPWRRSRQRRCRHHLVPNHERIFILGCHILNREYPFLDTHRLLQTFQHEHIDWIILWIFGKLYNEENEIYCPVGNWRVLCTHMLWAV